MKTHLWKRLCDYFAKPYGLPPSIPRPPIRHTPTGNPGTGSKPDDEVVKLLRSIDKRLATLESCVRTGIKHKPDTSHIVTGHWND